MLLSLHPLCGAYLCLFVLICCCRDVQLQEYITDWHPIGKYHVSRDTAISGAGLTKNEVTIHCVHRACVCKC